MKRGPAWTEWLTVHRFPNAEEWRKEADAAAYEAGRRDAADELLEHLKKLPHQSPAMHQVAAEIVGEPVQLCALCGKTGLEHAQRPPRHMFASRTK